MGWRPEHVSNEPRLRLVRSIYNSYAIVVNVGLVVELFFNVCVILVRPVREMLALAREGS
jgi:hypothetical protein